MKIVRVNKVFEVVEGFETVGRFSSMEHAVEFVNEYGEFLETRENRNTAKYGGVFQNSQIENVYVDKKILEEIYKVQYSRWEL